MDEAVLARTSEAYRLLLPTTARAGRVGGVLGARAGGSLELHDFRAYQPGDDVRHIDWNAAARTGSYVVRERREEVSPRAEIVLDASASMAVTPAKEARARELAVLCCRLAARQGLDPSLVVAGERAERARDTLERRVRDTRFEGRTPLVSVVRQGVLRPCGVRIVVSDLLFEAELDAFVGRLSLAVSSLSLVQVFDATDLEPDARGPVSLEDSESGERLEREIDDGVLASYRRRFAAHQSAVRAAARRARAAWSWTRADESLDVALRERLLGTLVEVDA